MIYFSLFFCCPAQATRRKKSDPERGTLRGWYRRSDLAAGEKLHRQRHRQILLHTGKRCRQLQRQLPKRLDRRLRIVYVYIAVLNIRLSHSLYHVARKNDPIKTPRERERKKRHIRIRLLERRVVRVSRQFIAIKKNDDASSRLCITAVIEIFKRENPTKSLYTLYIYIYTGDRLLQYQSFILTRTRKREKAGAYALTSLSVSISQ